MYNYSAVQRKQIPDSRFRLPRRRIYRDFLIQRLEEEGTTSPIIEEFKQHIKHRDTEQGGVSAITVWLESHASLHSWPTDNYISIDLYSCKLFDYEPVISFTKSFMRLKELNTLIVDRKMNGPAEVTNLKF